VNGFVKGLPPLAKRIILLGCAGSGKTTLARRLGDRTGHAVITLDAIWQPHWSDADLPNLRSLVRTAHAADVWISAGETAVPSAAA
jgi:adenylate kinase family enzyme